MSRRGVVSTLVLVALCPLRATAQQTGEVTLSWLPNTEADLAGYRVYYGTRSGKYRWCLNVEKEKAEITIVGLDVGVRYYFVVTAYDLRGNESLPSEEVSWVIGASEATPDLLGLAAPCPNPFRTSTTLELNMPQRGPVTVDVIDVRGRLVRRVHEGELPAGRNLLVWDGKAEDGVPAPAGAYFVVARTGRGVTSRPVVWLGR
ncbi:MAG: fibronectin type III domain-containing protein [candidate division KSB1 bacterium]|nr:fibronectin type III domain-containing protein [candidate division KSB1 bacterium]